jgi:hypothetical protein
MSDRTEYWNGKITKLLSKKSLSYTKVLDVVLKHPSVSFCDISSQNNGVSVSVRINQQLHGNTFNGPSNTVVSKKILRFVCRIIGIECGESSSESEEDDDTSSENDDQVRF